MATDLLEEEEVGMGFPDDSDSTMKKASKKWGLQVARAIWSYNRNNGNSLFYNSRNDYDDLIDFALGHQDPNIAKPVTGINPEQADQTWVRGVDWEVKNYATKRINIAVSKIARRLVDPVATPISPRGNDVIGERKAKIKAHMHNRDLFDQVGKTTGVSQTPFGIDPEKLPRDNEELDIFMQLADKPYVSMEIERRIKQYATRNNYDQKRQNMTWDGFVMGPLCCHVGMGPGYSPTIEWIDPREMIVPASNDPFYRDAAYFARVRPWTLAKLSKFRDEFTEMQWATIKDSHLSVVQENEENTDGTTNQSDEKLKKVQIMHFEYSTHNDKVFVSSVDANGNKRLNTRDDHKLKTEEQIQKFRAKYGTTRQFIRPGFEVIYEGYWVVGSDIIFNWGPKHFSPKKVGTLGERLFGYKVIVPNLKSNTVISNMSQMKSVLKDLQRVNAKIQQLLAAEIPDGFAIDIDALREAKLKLPGGALMSDLQLIDMAIQSGIYIYSGSNRRQGMDKPVTPTSNDKGSEKISKLMLLMQHYLRELDELIGFNEVTSAQALPESKGARVSQIQNEATDFALDHLFTGMHYMDREIYRTLAVLAVQAEKYGDKAKLKKIFGNNINKVVGEEVDITKFDYGIDIQPQPTQQEWAELNQDIREAEKNGQITISQRVIIKQFNNLKEAGAMLAIFEKRNREEASKAKTQDVQLNAEAQQASNQQTHDNAKELEQMKINASLEEKELDMRMEKLKHRNKMAELLAKSKTDSEGKKDQLRVKGEEDAQLAVIEGKVQEKVEKVKADVAPDTQPVAAE